jgi:hypothetical protein
MVTSFSLPFFLVRNPPRILLAGARGSRERQSEPPMTPFLPSLPPPVRGGGRRAPRVRGGALGKRQRSMRPHQNRTPAHTSQIPYRGAGGPTQTKPNPQGTYVCTVRFGAVSGDPTTRRPLGSAVPTPHTAPVTQAAAPPFIGTQGLHRLVGMGSGTVVCYNNLFLQSLYPGKSLSRHRVYSHAL